MAKLAAQGSAPAFTAIYKRHHQEIYRYCRSIVGEDDARDALQETMLKAMAALEGETRSIALRPWLYRIAHNEAITIVRRRRPTTPIQDVPEPSASDGDLETRERLRGLVEDLGQLAPRQRSALVMRELSGLSFDQISAALETSPAGAKQAVYEARCALQELERGRETTCQEIRSKISGDDRRVLRGRQVRAHLKACSDCRDFEAAIRARRSQLAAIAPLPAPIALGILHSILGGGGGGGGVAVVAAGGSMAGVAKLGIAGVIALGVGTAALEQRSGHPTGDTRPAGNERTVKLDQTVAPSAVSSVAYAKAVASGATAAKQAGDRGAGRSPAGGDDRGRSGGQGVASAGSASTPGSAPAGAPVSESTTPAPASDNLNSQGPTGTPPGHGGVPPGQGGTPPGLEAPPPGLGGIPPGQGGTPPGLEAPPPGLGGTPPGQTITPPGQG